MELQRRIGGRSSGLFLLLILLQIGLRMSTSSSVEAYKNYTVGDSLGWFDNLEKPTVDYQKWAADKTFSLGDFLIFNTDTNHSVIQTYNSTTYKLCDYDDSADNDTTQWSAGDPSASDPQPVTVAVPLLKEGMNYFFSGDYDGDQCKNGQLFKINVTYGQGLPPSLKSPSAGQSDSPAAAPDSGADDQSVPDLVVPSSFNNPKNATSNDDDDTGESQSHSGSSVSSTAPLRYAISITLFYHFLSPQFRW